MNEPLDYRKDAARKDQIVIDRFDDGGVTITIPPAASFKRPGAVVCAAAVIGGLFAVEFWLMWRLGYSVRSVALDLQRTASILAQPVFLILYLLAAGFISARIYLARRHYSSAHGNATVVSISPQIIYIYHCFFPVRLVPAVEVPRGDLQGVRLIEWKKTMTGKPRCVEIKLFRRQPFYICNDRTPNEVLQVYEALIAAKRSTAARPANIRVSTSTSSCATSP